MQNYFPLELPDIVAYAVPFFGLLVVLEIFLATKSKSVSYETKDTMASLGMGLGNQVLSLVLAGLVASITIFAYKHRFFELGTGPLVFFLCFFLEDLTYYWAHRIGHERRYFWASHVVHHSSQHYNLSTALRQTWTGNLSGGFLFWIPLALIGIHPAIIFMFQGISLVYQFWFHTEAIDKMPKWFEAVFNTPSHHRVHHATNPEYLDRNYGGVLIIWDRIFGTFVLESETPKYGIVSNLGTFNPLRIAIHEWVGIIKDVKNAKSLHELWGFIMGPPGWTPDGTRKTSEMIKLEWQKLKNSQ